MFFGVQKSRELHRVLRSNPRTRENASKLVLLAWFTVLDSSLDIAIRYLDAISSGYSVVARGPAAGPLKFLGIVLFLPKAWFGIPIRDMVISTGVDLVGEHHLTKTIEIGYASLLDIPMGRLVLVKDGLFVRCL